MTGCGKRGERNLYTQSPPAFGLCPCLADVLCASIPHKKKCRRMSFLRNFHRHLCFFSNGLILHEDGCCQAALMRGKTLVELGELVVRTEHFNDLVLVHLLHEVASGTAVLTGIEFSGLVSEHLANGSGEGKTGV